VEGDELVRGVLADEIIADLNNIRGTYCDPEDFRPFLGPMATEYLTYRQRAARPPDPGAEQFLEAFVRHNPARLHGDLAREYRRVTLYLPSLLEHTDSFEWMQRRLWVMTTQFIHPDVVGPEERFDAIAQDVWQQRVQN
jgi:hypothetical protein